MKEWRAAWLLYDKLPFRDRLSQNHRLPPAPERYLRSSIFISDDGPTSSLLFSRSRCYYNGESVCVSEVAVSQHAYLDRLHLDQRLVVAHQHAQILAEELHLVWVLEERLVEVERVHQVQLQALVVVADDMYNLLLRQCAVGVGFLPLVDLGREVPDDGLDVVEVQDHRASRIVRIG